MHIKRTLEPVVKKLATQYPIVTLVGPRQSGKTTLVRHVFPNKPYLSLEDIDVREFASRDPRGFLNLHPEGCILDEIQRAPDLLSYIQTKVDADKQKGMYILTGSHQLSLHHAVNQSLAGRTAILDLLPLSFEELAQAGVELDTDKQMVKGFYPRIYESGIEGNRFYRDYLRTYVERDVRNIIQIKELALFEKFLTLLAGRVGQLLNLNNLTNEIGVSGHTLKQWLSVLEASFIIFKLMPFHENISKRLVKSPKIYFYDTGLLAMLLGIKNIEHMSKHPLRGNIFENMVVSDILKQSMHQGETPDAYFYRDQNQREVDLILQDGHELIPVEIKASETFHSHFLKNLTFLKKLLPERVKTPQLIYAGPHEQEVEGAYVAHYKHYKTKLY